VALAPEAILHEIDPFDQRVIVEACRQQLGQLTEGALKSGAIIPRFDELYVPPVSRHPAYLYHRYFIAKKYGKRDLFRLDFGIRELHAKRKSQAVPLSGVASQLPHRVQIEASRARLDIAPITADV
jgi:hypothetical protein